MRIRNFFRLLGLVPVTILAATGCESPKTVTPVVRDMTISVYAPGRLVDRDAYLVFSPATGILNEWVVEEGDSVKPGALLARIDNSNSELNQENALIRVNELKNNLRPGSSFRQDIDLAVANARLKYRDDSVTLGRQQNLWDQQVGSLRELEARKLAAQQSKQLYESTLERRKLQLEQLKVDLKTAENLLRISKNQNQDFLVESKIAGIIAEQLVKEGEWVTPLQPIGKMGGQGDYLLELEVDQVDIVRIDKGMEVMISLDAYPDQVFRGTVSKVNTQKNEQAQSYLIEVVFRDEPERWFSGMTAEANIVIGKRENALLVPQACLMEGNRVITKNGDTLELKIGETDLEFAEVLEGLSPETQLILPGS